MSEELYKRVNDLEIKHAKVSERMENHKEEYHRDVGHIHECLSSVRLEVATERKDHKADMEKVHGRLNNIMLLLFVTMVGIIAEVVLTVIKSGIS